VPAVFGLVGQANGLALDGDAALPFDIHGVQDLIFEIPAETMSVAWMSRSERVDLP
jgi:hypothetical protein